MNTLMNNKKLIGNSEWSNEIRNEIERVAGYPSTVLITGPTGTGKEVIAELIHAHSSRANKPMLAVDCTSLPASLFESQLFGHVKGAFTGAANDTMGLFRAAEGGTIFLDEIGELEPLQQAKLLRVLQTKTIVPVGSHEPIKVDVRVVAATNRDLEEEVREGRFRADLFYRLNVVKLNSLALRDRQSDIEVLAQYFLDQFAESNGWPKTSLSNAALNMLQAYDWPGNVRELENMLERAALYSTDPEIGCEAFPALADVVPATNQAESGLIPVVTADALAMPQACVDAAAAMGQWLKLDELERYHVEQTLRQTFYNQSAAARMLGVSRQSLIRKIKQHGIQIPAKDTEVRSDAEFASV